MNRMAAGAGVAVCAAAAASLALPSVPTTDPWGWIVWGRELAGGELDTDVGGSPSWKPLPVAFTAALALLGDAAPEAWLLVARALGLLGVVLAFLAGRRMAGPGAGVVAAVALALAGGWLRGLEHGYAEPLVITALLGALLAWLDGRPGVCLGLAATAALARPELWPLATAVAVAARGRMPHPRAAWTAVAAVPVLWVGVDWLASGRPFNGSGVAAGVARDLSPGDLLALSLAIPVLPVLVLAVAGALLGGRDAALLGAGVVAAALGLAAAVGVGYPPSERLMMPLMAAVSVLAGVGAARLVAGAKRGPSAGWSRAPSVGRSRGPNAGGKRVGVPVAVGAALVALSAPFAVARVDVLGKQARMARERAALQLDLRRAARLARPTPSGDAPGARAVALPADLHWARGAVAWEWGLPLGRVYTLAEPPRTGRLVVFVPASRHVAHGHTLARTRAWRVFAESPRARAGGPRLAAARNGG